jgi:hypothetical protein
MSWQDVYFDRNLNRDEIITGLSQLFHVDSQTVAVQFDTVDLTDTEGLRVVCGVFTQQGEFPTYLEIVPLEAALIPQDKYEAIGILCEIFTAYALIPYDMDTNPYTSTLIRKRHDYQKVKLDPDKLDDEQEEQVYIVEYLEKFDV